MYVRFELDSKGQVSQNLSPCYHAPIHIPIHTPLCCSITQEHLPIISHPHAFPTNFLSITLLDTCYLSPTFLYPSLRFFSPAATSKPRGACADLSPCIYHHFMHQYHLFDYSQCLSKPFLLDSKIYNDSLIAHHKWLSEVF